MELIHIVMSVHRKILMIMSLLIHQSIILKKIFMNDNTYIDKLIEDKKGREKLLNHKTNSACKKEKKKRNKE